MRKKIKQILALTLLIGLIAGLCPNTAKAEYIYVDSPSLAMKLNWEGVTSTETKPYIQAKAIVTKGDMSKTSWGVKSEYHTYMPNSTTLDFSPVLRISKEGIYEMNISLMPINGFGNVYEYNDTKYKLQVTVIKNSNGTLSAARKWFQDGKEISQPSYTIAKVYSDTGGSSSGDPAGKDVRAEIVTRAEKAMEKMTLEQKVGQLFVTHFDGGHQYKTDQAGEMAKAKELITKYHPGGILLFKWNCEYDTPQSLTNKITEAQKTSDIPLSVQVDEEGGRVTRVSCVPALRYEAFKAPQEVLAKGLDYVYDDARYKASFLCDFGFNMNLAPVADTATTGYIYDRTYGGNGTENAKAVKRAVEGHEAYGNGRVGSCLKHFPGYGSTSANTHNGFAVNNLTLEQFRSNDLIPFKEGINAGADMVLITHNIINCLDTENPATMSPAIYKLLREECKFTRVAITDDLGMGAITDYLKKTGKTSAAAEAFKAGADMVITAKLETEYPKVLAIAKSGELPIKQINDSVVRILANKMERKVIDQWVSPIKTDPEASFVDKDGEPVDSGSLADMWEYTKTMDGSVVLQKDVSTASTFTLSGKNLTVDLNGHKLTYTGKDTLFDIKNKSDFTLIDKNGEIIIERSDYGNDGHHCLGDDTKGEILFHINKQGFKTEINREDQTAGAVIGSKRGQIIRAANSNIHVETCQVLDARNSAIEASGTGNVTINNAYFSGNSTEEHGGAIRINGQDCPLIVNGSTAFTYNNATGNGGAIYTEGEASLIANAILVRNGADSGGAIYADSLTLDGGPVIGWNVATKIGGGAAAISNTNIHGDAKGPYKALYIVQNQVTNHGGGIYTRGTENTISGKIITEENRSPDGYSGLYLSEGTQFDGTGLDASGKILVRTESTADEIPVIKQGSGMTENHKGLFITGDINYTVALDNDGITLVKDKTANLSYGVLIDGEYLEAGRLKAVNGTDLVGDGERLYFIELNDMLKSLKEYGITEESLKNRIFGVLDKEKQTVTTPEKTPEETGGKYRMYITKEVYENGTLVFLPNTSEPGTKSVTDTARENGFWTIDVRDIRQITLNPGTEQTKRVEFVKSGGSKTLELPDYGGFWTWHAVESESNQFQATFNRENGKIKAQITDVYSPVVITNGTDKDIMYTVQHYAYVDTYDLSDIERADRLPVIDTSGAVLPKNETTQNVKYLTVDTANGNGILKNRNLTRMYDDTRYVYRVSPRLTSADKMKRNAGYELSEVWVLKDGRNATSTNDDDFIQYKKDEIPDIESLQELKLTTNPEKANDKTIVIKENSVLRFIYRPVHAEHEINSTFYDYDITSGKIYSSSSLGTQYEAPTSSQDNGKKFWANTYQQGINHPDNYHTTGAKLAFGNANTDNGVDSEKTADGFFINRGNYTSVGSWPNNVITETVYKRCSFGLVDGILGNVDTGFYPKYTDGIAAPYLFQQGEAKGKTPFYNVPLIFDQVGDNYTLNRVSDTVAQNLGVFSHPGYNGTEYTHIWTNNFWPADSLSSWGADNHDPKFGDYKLSTKQYFKGKTKELPLPTSDDGLNHNSYFGMTSTVSFTLPAGYQGPLEYVFFGDDDMWLFLDDTLILDIGGVHSSVGEYVNLWDYLEKSDKDQTHRLTFFYTERGASGSTCYMGFNIPGIEGEPEPIDEGQLDISKKVTGLTAPEGDSYEFHVKITDENGNVPLDDYCIRRLDKDRNITDYGILEGGEGTFKITNGEHLYLPDLPEGYKYTVTETKDNRCETSFETDGEKTERHSVSGTVKGNAEITITCINHYELGAILPDTGSNTLRNLWIISLTLISIGTIALIALKRRRVK